jgi:preprotein translocase subunit SecA
VCLRRQVIDHLWGEFLEDLKSVETAVSLRTFSQLDPLDELRLEGGEASLVFLIRARLLVPFRVLF